MSFQAVILIMSVLPLSRCPCQGNQNLRTDPIWSAKWSDRSLALVLALILEPIPSSMTDPSASLTARFIGWNALNRWKIGGLCFVFAWFFIGGIAHFALTRTEMRIVPSWLPSPHVIVLISGAFELLGAAGLIWWRTRRIAGIGLFALTLAVTPANIYAATPAIVWRTRVAVDRAPAAAGRFAGVDFLQCDCASARTSGFLKSTIKHCADNMVTSGFWQTVV